MEMTIYIGNLPYAASEDEIRSLFERYGPVNSVKFIRDRDSGRFRGFGFIEMSRRNGELAISKLDGKEYSGRDLRVNEAKNKSGHTKRQRHH